MKFDLFSITAPILALGLAAEVFLPYALLWSSDEFLFDIPDWALWFAFGGPPLVSVGAFLGKVGRKHFFFGKKKQKTFAI